MKRKVRQLKLTRETVVRLGEVFGAVTLTNQCTGCRCSYTCNPDDGGTESSICNSNGVCSRGCASGGTACTAGC